MAYREGIGENGNLSDSVLKKVDTGHKLHIPAADSFMRMKADAKKEGVDIKLYGAYSAYRPCGKKGDYKERNCSTGFTQWCAWEKYVSGKGNLAANPTDSDGCSSNHGYGIAIDVDGSKGQNWIRKNGEKYGWWWGEAPTESWHFTYDKKRDQFLDRTNLPDDGKKPNKIPIVPILLIVSGLALGTFVYLKYKKKI